VVTPAELPSNRYYIFGKEGGKKLAEKMNVHLLGQIPLYRVYAKAVIMVSRLHSATQYQEMLFMSWRRACRECGKTEQGTETYN